MAKLDILRTKVAELYGAMSPTRADWADWLYTHHVLVVAKLAKEMASKYQANPELSEVAALLHDIADCQLKRSASEHAEVTLFISRAIMAESGYTPKEIGIVVDDAVRYHNCHDGMRPSSQEGLVLATADSMHHLQSDFYIYATWALGKEKSLEEIKDWVLKKIDRDLQNKIQFEDERQAVINDYERIKLLYSK